MNKLQPAIARKPLTSHNGHIIPQGSLFYIEQEDGFLCARAHHTIGESQRDTPAEARLLARHKRLPTRACEYDKIIAEYDFLCPSGRRICEGQMSYWPIDFSTKLTVPFFGLCPSAVSQTLFDELTRN